MATYLEGTTLELDVGLRDIDHTQAAIRLTDVQHGDQTAWHFTMKPRGNLVEAVILCTGALHAGPCFESELLHFLDTARTPGHGGTSSLVDGLIEVDDDCLGDISKGGIVSRKEEANVDGYCVSRNGREWKVATEDGIVCSSE